MGIEEEKEPAQKKFCKEDKKKQWQDELNKALEKQISAQNKE